MAYKITAACLQCGTCLPKCPQKAIVPGKKIQLDGMWLQPVHIEPHLCNDCGICLSDEYWCPGQAITRG
jgi:ferredoxin